MKLPDYLSAERGRGASLASAVGVTQVMISQWAAGIKQVPPDRCVSIEKATSGAVTRRDLRPDDWSRFWPELYKAKAAA